MIHKSPPIAANISNAQELFVRSQKHKKIFTYLFGI